jgi:CO dehydrogenase maturation factor
MILGFLGKGGSGKSSVSTQMALFLESDNKKVLAIDADHNMDLTFNLFNGETPKDINYLGASAVDVKKAVDLDEDSFFSDAFKKNTDKYFSISNPDSFTKKYSKDISEKIQLMAAGPQTEKVLDEKACSHSLAAPLKIYLPLLKLEGEEFVVVDEKAGADGVSSGIASGIDVGVVVCEPALHSIKTAKQIAKLLDYYKTPCVFVGNKIQSEDDKDFIEETLGEKPVTFLLDSDSIKKYPSKKVDSWSDEMEEILKKSKELNNSDRLDRTIAKYKK